MANIKGLKKRIKTTKSTFKITSAMKLVSAAKLAKAQHKILGLRPYAKELVKCVKTASALNQEYSHPYLKTDASNAQSYLLVISSDKGLCGGYNNQIVKRVRTFLAENSQENFKVLFIGKKARDVLAKDVNVGKTFTFEKIDPSINEIRNICEELSTAFTTGEVGKIYLVYNQFISAINYNCQVETLLPMTSSEDEATSLQSSFPYDFKYEPDANVLLDSMIPEVLFTSLYSAILDAIASEHGARMSAMENATKNCKDMIKKLTLKMNKLRQAAITTELIEVISGAESLNN